ncbi:hypothetical protein D3C72_1422160 [compost metagenome]
MATPAGTANAADVLKRSLTLMSYTSTEPEKPAGVFQVKPSDRFFDFSGFSACAPSRMASGSLLARRPLVNNSRVLVSRPWFVLLVFDWPGVGARKPVE